MRGSLATLGLGVLALACCAAGPLLAAAIGGTSLVALVGWGAALVAGIAAIGFLVARRARHGGRHG